MGVRRRLIVVSGFLALVPLVLGAAPGKLRLTSPCKLEAAVRGVIRARTDGVVEELTTREGARVRRGEMVGHLAMFELEQRVAEQKAQLRSTQCEIAAVEEELPAAARATLAGEAGPFLHGQRTEAQRRSEAARADLQAARSRLEEARAAVDAQRRIAARLRVDVARASRGRVPPALAAARQTWQQHLAEWKVAHRDYDRYHRLLVRGFVSPEQTDTARSRSQAAERVAAGALQEFKAAAKSLRESAEDAEEELARRETALATARAAVLAAEATAAAGHEAARAELVEQRTKLRCKRQEAKKLEAEIAAVTDHLQRSTLLAPCDGVVTTPRVEDRLGARFPEGATVLEVEDPTSLYTRIFVNERELGEVRVGQPVSLRIAAFPQRLYRGRVSEIAPRAVAGGSAAFPTTIVEVRVTIANATGELRTGLSGWAKIDCGRRPLGRILLRRVARYLRTEVWSWF